MLRRNRKKDEALTSDEPRGGAHHIPSQPTTSSLIFRTNSPPIAAHDQPALPLTLPNSFAPHAKSSTTGSSNSGNGQTSNSTTTTNNTYPQAPASSQFTSPSSSTTPAGVPRSPPYQDRQLPGHILHPSVAQNQYHRATAEKKEAMMPPAKRSAKGTRHLQNAYTDSPYSQSVDALGSEGLHSVQGNEPNVPTPSQAQQPANVGRSQSALNFLLAKARASFSSSSSSNASMAASAGAATIAPPPAFQSQLIPSASVSVMQASGSMPFHEERNMLGRTDGVIGRNRVASESSGSLLQNSGTKSGQRARPSFGEESAPASSPTKRGFFSRERKASVVSLGKSGSAARQAFSNSPLGRAPLVRYGSPTDRKQGSSPLISQFSKSQSDLHSRHEFPSPPSLNMDLPPNFLSPSQSVSVMQSAAHRAAANSGDSALLRSPSPNVGFSRSVDDLNHDRASAPGAPPDFLFSSPAGRHGPWGGEQGLAPTDRGRASDTGALGLGRSRGGSVTLDASPSTGQVNVNGNLRNAWEYENQTYDSPRHQRKSSRPKINVEAADSHTSSGLASPRDHPRPVLGPGATYDGLLLRNTNVSMSINQLNGKDKEKDIGKGWKPFRVVLREGRMYFYKPSSSVADEVKLLFPTSLTPADNTQRRDTSPARLSPKGGNSLSTSPSGSVLSMEDIKRGKLSTRDLLAATSSSQDTDGRPNARRHQKDSRLSAIMDSAEAESTISTSTQPISLPEWAHADAHGELLFSSSPTLPPAWVDRIRGGSPNALAHEYVYATQSNGSSSSRENAAMLQFIMDHLRETSMPPQVFLSSVRKWAARALLEEGKAEDGFDHDVKARLDSIVDANLPAQMGDEGARIASQHMVNEIAEQFQLFGTTTESGPSNWINMRADHARGAPGSLNVPNESQRLVSTSAPSHFNTSPILPQSAPTEKETRRMTAFFRTAVRPMGLMSSSPSTLASETIPRGYNELLSSVALQKPAAAVQCGSSRVSIWHNAQRSYVFNLTPPDGGHILLQAHSGQEMQDCCNAIEQASKSFAKSVMASAEMQRKSSGGAAVPASVTPKSGKAAPKIAMYGTDLKILAEQEGSGVPLGLARMLEEVEKRGLREQGLYRISGAKSAIEALKGAFMTQSASSVNLSTGELSDVHTIAGAIKQWFRDLPEPTIPFASYRPLMAAERIEGEEDRLYAFRDILWDIPRAHFELLRRISAHLAMVCDEGTYNLMAPHNIGLVFGTSLLNPPPGPASVAESFGNIGKAAHIVKIIVTMHEWLFEPEPEPEAETGSAVQRSQQEAVEHDAEGHGSAVDSISANEGGQQKEKAEKDVAACDEEDETPLEGDAAAGHDEKILAARSGAIEDGEAKDAGVKDGEPKEKEEKEEEEEDEEEEKGSNTLTLSQSEDTSGSTTLGLDAEPITPADGSEAGMDQLQDDSTPRQSLADSDGAPVPWLDNPLLTVDEGTIDSHASDSSMMRAVLGVHPISPVKADDRKPTRSAVVPETKGESGIGGMATVNKSLSAANSNSDLRPSLSRANSSQQVFSDVDEDLPGSPDHSQQLQQRQQRHMLSTEPHDRTVESVYLDATDAMAILQSNFEEGQQEGQQEGRRSVEEVEEVLETRSPTKRAGAALSSSSSSSGALQS